MNSKAQASITVKDKKARVCPTASSPITTPWESWKSQRSILWFSLIMRSAFMVVENFHVHSSQCPSSLLTPALTHMGCHFCSHHAPFHHCAHYNDPWSPPMSLCFTSKYLMWTALLLLGLFFFKTVSCILASSTKHFFLP